MEIMTERKLIDTDTLHNEVNSLTEEFSKFKNALQASHKRVKKLTQIIGSEEQENLAGEFSNILANNLVSIEGQMDRNKSSLDKFREEMAKAKESEKSVKTQIVEYERIKHDLETKIQHWNYKKKKLAGDRDKILMYKLLTEIHFSYEGSTVNGYVRNQHTKKIKYFNFSPEKLSQEEITNSLFDLVKKISNEEPEVTE